MAAISRTSTHPQASIRRFDIFAEWNRLTALRDKHMRADDARAYGISVAKVVAARKFTGYQPGRASTTRRSGAKRREEDWWKHMGSTDEFERKVIRRMGEDFYRHTFAPALKSAFESGMSYEEVRDSFRREWNESIL
jgi:hypothetical protein